MINHHYAISPSFHSCCRVFCDIEWSLSQKGIYVSLHGWIIAKCVQKKLWTFDWGGWIYCNDSMNADVFNFDFHFSNFQDWLLRQGGFCPLPPTPWTPPPPWHILSHFSFHPAIMVYTHNSSKGWLLGCTNSYHHLSYQPNAHKTQ